MAHVVGSDHPHIQNVLEVFYCVTWMPLRRIIYCLWTT